MFLFSLWIRAISRPSLLLGVLLLEPRIEQPSPRNSSTYMIFLFGITRNLNGLLMNEQRKTASFASKIACCAFKNRISSVFVRTGNRRFLGTFFVGVLFRGMDSDCLALGRSLWFCLLCSRSVLSVSTLHLMVTVTNTPEPRKLTRT